MSGNRFVKGRTNNHLTWVMVDATDFATPESALSAATKIKIYGKVRGATGVNFVSSGAGSLTNDIVHVGASALGIYTIALAKADLSDASNAWYDQYIVSLSATGAAYQTLIVDGGINDSAISAYQSRLSDLASALLVVQSMASDAHSAALLGASAASDAYSAALIIQSRLSDFDSRLVSDVSDIRSMLTALSDAVSDAHSDLGSKIGAITASVSASDISDIASAVWANTIGARVDSRVLLNQSRISDVYSAIVAGVPLDASTISDIRSAIAAAELDASDLSDIASAVWANSIGTRVDSRVLLIQSLASDAHSAAILGASHASDAHSAATLAASRALLLTSRLSDLDSRLVSDVSDIRSMLTALSDAVSDAHSDLGSKIGAITASVSASDISDIASAVWANTIGARVDSRVLLNLSRISDIYSLVSDLNSHVVTTGVPLDASTISDLRSAINAGPAATVTASDISDIASAVWAFSTRSVSLVASTMSDIRSAIAAGPAATVTASDISDIASAVWANAIGARVDSRVLLNQSRISDVQSVLAAGVPLDASTMSDLRSAIAGVAATLSASDISDIASAVWANTIGARVDSRVLVTLSAASDAASAAQVGASRALINQSRISDVQSVLAAGVPLDASTISDLRSAIAATELDASDLSGIAGAVWDEVLTGATHNITNSAGRRLRLIDAAFEVHAGTAQAGSTSTTFVMDTGASTSNDIYNGDRIIITAGTGIGEHGLIIDYVGSTRTATMSKAWVITPDATSEFAVIPADVDVESWNNVAVTGDGDWAELQSRVIITQSMASDAHSAATLGASRALLNQSRISDVYSLLSDLHSDVGVVSGVVSDAYSLLTAGVEVGASSLSDIRSAITANGILAAGAEPTTVIGHTDNLKAKIDWLTALSRNKITQTATLQSLRNDADTSTIASATVSDDATTFTRAEWSS